MHPLISPYADLFTELHGEIERTIDGLAGGLDWSPGLGMNSAAVLVTHTTASERFWVGEVAGGDPSHRDRPAEFLVHDLSPEILKERMAATLAHTLAVLDRLTPADLERTLPELRHDKPVTAGWAVAHALEHAATHLGHLQLMRDLWKQKG